MLFYVKGGNTILIKENFVPKQLKRKL